MGGKPWTSKGCVDCRRRKIKCDERRPECERCVKFGIKCQGWEKYRNFVGAASIAEAKRQNPTVKTDPNTKYESWSVQGSSSSPAGPPQAKLPIVVHSAQALRGQVFASFIQRYFSSQPLSSATNFDESIVLSIAGLPQRSQMTERALSALSCIYLGKTSDNPTFLKHGLSLYFAAIRQLSNMINRGVYANDICYTVFLFQEIDLMYAPYGLSSWGTHVAGMNTLLRCYTTKSSNNPIVDTIRHWQKLQIVFTSTGMRLSKSEYDYIMEPTNGDALLEIIQATVTIGDLEAAILSIDPNHPDFTACTAIVQKCYTIYEAQMRLYQCGQLGETPLRSQLTNYPRILSPGSLFGFAYDFSSPNNAFLHIMFCGNMIFLQSLIGRANNLARHHVAAMTGIYTSSQFEDLALVHRDKYADKVARAIPYCLQDCMKLSFSKIAVYGLSVIAIRYITTSSYEKHKWSIGGLKHLTGRGFDAASHLSALAVAKLERSREGAIPLTSLRKAASDWNSNPVPLPVSESEGQDLYLQTTARSLLD